MREQSFVGDAVSLIKKNKVERVKLGRPCDVEGREQLGYAYNNVVTERRVKTMQKTPGRNNKNLGAKNGLEWGVFGSLW